MIRTVIIDDEPRSIKLIAGMIAQYCPKLSVIGTTDNLGEALPLVENLKPSLLLLDIEFPPGTIFSMLEKLVYRNFQVVFITAYNSYAAQAFKQNAVDYILKPVTKEALVEAITRVEARMQDRSSVDISKLVNLLRSQNSSVKVALPSAEGILFVDEMDIFHCEASGRYTIIYFSDKKLIISKTLKEVEALLSPAHFFRIHHSHIINLDKVTKYHRGDGGWVELINGAQINVSSSRKEELLDILMNSHRQTLQ